MFDYLANTKQNATFASVTQKHTTNEHEQKRKRGNQSKQANQGGNG